MVRTAGSIASFILLAACAPAVSDQNSRASLPDRTASSTEDWRTLGNYKIGMPFEDAIEVDPAQLDPSSVANCYRTLVAKGCTIAPDFRSPPITRVGSGFYYVGLDISPRGSVSNINLIYYLGDDVTESECRNALVTMIDATYDRYGPFLPRKEAGTFLAKTPGNHPYRYPAKPESITVFGTLDGGSETSRHSFLFGTYFKSSSDTYCRVRLSIGPY